MYCQAERIEVVRLSEVEVVKLSEVEAPFLQLRYQRPIFNLRGVNLLFSLKWVTS